MAQFLDKTGLTTLWSKIKALVTTQVSNAVTTVGAYKVNGYNVSTNPTLTKSDVGLGNVTNESKATMFTSPTFTGTPTAPTPAAATENTQIATTAYVAAKVNAMMSAADAMQFKGTIGTSGTVTSVPNTHEAGWTYKVITANTYAGHACEVGDLLVCIKDGTTSNNNDWTVVQANIDGAVTGPASSIEGHVAIFSGNSGKIVKDSGFTIESSVPIGAAFTDTDTKVTSAANHYAPSEDTSAAISASGGTATDVVSATTQVVTGLKRDSKGHVVGVTSVGIKATNTTYSLASASANGLMSKDHFTKLSNIDSGATADSAITNSEIDAICV